MIVALVLAAGAARRFGSQKLLQPVRGEPLVRAAVDRVVAAGPEQTIVVVGHDAPGVRHALAGLPVTIVENPHPEQGLSSSLRAGLAMVPSNAVAVLVTLGDQPIDRDEVFPALVARFGGDEAPIVAPRYQGVQGLPVLFARAVFPELERAHRRSRRPRRRGSAIRRAWPTWTSTFPCPPTWTRPRTSGS